MSPTKRLFDIVSSGIGLILVSPILITAALAVKWQDGGPAFFRQERIGLGGKTFRIWKFRTMVVNADKIGSHTTVGGDPRITRVGRFLRKSKIDELPQLINVFMGDMSVVGPRPDVWSHVKHYTPEQRKIFEIVPGITSPASVLFRHEEELLAKAADPEKCYLEEIMPQKLQMCIDYHRTATFMSDMRIILKTLKIL